MRNLCLFFFLTIAMYPSFLHAQESDSSYHAMDSAITADHLSSGHIIWHDVKEGADDGWHYVVRPVYWNIKEWAIIGTVAGATLMMEAADDQVAREFFQRNQGTFGNNLFWFTNNIYGTGYATAAAFISLYSIGLATDNTRVRIMGRQVVQSFAYAGLTTTLLKVLFGRARPFANKGPFNFHSLTLQNIWNSLPSGHCTVAAALSETLAADIDQPWAYVTFYTLEGLTAFGRMYADKHWLSDTFAGLMIGNLTGFWVSRETEHYDLKTNQPKSTSFVIEPTMDGVSLAYHF